MFLYCSSCPSNEQLLQRLPLASPKLALASVKLVKPAVVHVSLVKSAARCFLAPEFTNSNRKLRKFTFRVIIPGNKLKVTFEFRTGFLAGGF